MAQWKDYYQILEVKPDATIDEIRKAYRRLAKKYHPDVNQNDADAEKKFINIKEAFDILRDTQKRAKYHSEWLKRLSPPKPLVKPNYILFENVALGESKRATFEISNIGGPCNSEIFVSNPDSWVRIIGSKTVGSSDDELPLAVEIEAVGNEWGKFYSETIEVKLDEKLTHVKVELQTKKAPATSGIATQNQNLNKTVNFSMIVFAIYYIFHAIHQGSSGSDILIQFTLGVAIFFPVNYFILQLIGGIVASTWLWIYSVLYFLLVLSTSSTSPHSYVGELAFKVNMVLFLPGLISMFAVKVLNYKLPYQGSKINFLVPLSVYFLSIVILFIFKPYE